MGQAWDRPGGFRGGCRVQVNISSGVIGVSLRDGLFCVLVCRAVLLRGHGFRRVVNREPYQLGQLLMVLLEESQRSQGFDT